MIQQVKTTWNPAFMKLNAQGQPVIGQSVSAFAQTLAKRDGIRSSRSKPTNPEVMIYPQTGEECYSVQRVGFDLCCRSESVQNRINKGIMIAHRMPHPTRARVMVGLPKWQFTREVEPFIKELRQARLWTADDTMTTFAYTPFEALDGRTPKEAILAGDGQAVLALAKSMSL